MPGGLQFWTSPFGPTTALQRCSRAARDKLVNAASSSVLQLSPAISITSPIPSSKATIFESLPGRISCSRKDSRGIERIRSGCVVSLCNWQLVTTFCSVDFGVNVMQSFVPGRSPCLTFLCVCLYSNLCSSWTPQGSSVSNIALHDVRNSFPDPRERWTPREMRIS